MRMSDSFPQKISLRLPDLQKSLKSLTEESNRVNGYFSQLLETWGESKETYTADSFFDVFIQFYDQFIGELNLLEKKKKEAEEIRKKREAQEKMARSIQEHAMDNFQKDMAGKASNDVGVKWKNEL